MRRTTIVGSVLQTTGHAVVASAVGLIALPLVFSGGPYVGSPQAWLWLAASAFVSAWLLLLGPVLARGLALLLARLPRSSQHRGASETFALRVSQRMLAVAYVVVLQAIIRRPLVGVLGAAAEPIVVEAMFAVVALLVLLMLLALLHQVGKPLVEGLAIFGLDTMVATSGSEVPVALASITSHTDAAPASTPTVLAPAEPMAQHTLAAHTRPAVARPGGQRGSVA